MKYQSLFSGKNKKNISLPSAELAQRVVKAKDPNQLVNPYNLFRAFTVLFLESIKMEKKKT